MGNCRRRSWTLKLIATARQRSKFTQSLHKCILNRDLLSFSDGWARLWKKDNNEKKKKTVTAVCVPLRIIAFATEALASSFYSSERWIKMKNCYNSLKIFINNSWIASLLRLYEI